MSRPIRIQYSGAVYHIISRGNKKEAIFKNNKDFTLFLDILSEVIERYNWKLYAYCLMKNHYHLLIETIDPNLSQGMLLLNGKYTQKFNRRYDTCGHLFQGRFKAFIIDRESYLLEVVKYIILNPVNAGIVKSPSEYKWSSFNDIISNKRNINIDFKTILNLFENNIKNPIEQFIEFISSGDKFDYKKNLTGKIFLGDIKFAKKVMKYSRGAKRFKEIAKKSRFVDRPKLKEIFGRIRNIERRNELIYESHIKYGYSFSEIAKYLKLHYSTVSKAFSNLKNRKKIVKNNSDKFKT